MRGGGGKGEVVKRLKRHFCWTNRTQLSISIILLSSYYNLYYKCLHSWHYMYNVHYILKQIIS